MLHQNFESYKPEVQELICVADRLGSLMQYETPGFLPNKRIHRGILQLSDSGNVSDKRARIAQPRCAFKKITCCAYAKSACDQDRNVQIHSLKPHGKAASCLGWGPCRANGRRERGLPAWGLHCGSDRHPRRRVLAVGLRELQEGAELGGDSLGGVTSFL